MYVMHKQGLKNRLWLTVKRLNENLTATINTHHGKTRPIKMKDNIRQGGVLSVIQFALLMDEISKNIHNENLGIQIDEKTKIGCLEWVDDIALLTKNSPEMQKM